MKTHAHEHPRPEMGGGLGGGTQMGWDEILENVVVRAPFGRQAKKNPDFSIPTTSPPLSALIYYFLSALASDSVLKGTLGPE